MADSLNLGFICLPCTAINLNYEGEVPCFRIWPAERVRPRNLIRVLEICVNSKVDIISKSYLTDATGHSLHPRQRPAGGLLPARQQDQRGEQ